MWVLVFFFIGSNTMTLTPIEFTSRDSCLDAKRKINIQIEQVVTRAGKYRRPYVDGTSICVKK